MNQRSIIWALVVSFVWLIMVFIFACSYHYTLPDSLNELGDFLAGIFAPVAFFWLILGYIQQGKQLEQNTIALEQQKEALKSQIKEMSKGLEQQKKVVLLMEQERNDLKRQVKPNIEILNIHTQFIDGNNFRITLDIKNNGVGDASHIKILLAEVLTPLTILKVESTQRIPFEISKKDFDWSFSTYDYNITLSYCDILSNHYVSIKKLIIKNNQNRVRNLETQIVDID